MPPAWTDVWIAADPTAHIQATGRDARGRKQYRYHDEWRRHRSASKFDDLAPFGDALGGLRHRVDEDLARRGMPIERMVALVVALLDETGLRVGNEAYARENRTFGLTTLRCRHAEVDGCRLHLSFRGKGGTPVDVTCSDRRLARLVSRCQDLPGQLLFQYVDDDDEVRPVRSSDVNDYLHEATGIDATAKTFRTWTASVLAASLLAPEPVPESERGRAQVLNEVIDEVAGTIGNARAVCRASYIHPVVMESWSADELNGRWTSGPSRRAGGLEVDERRFLAVIGSGNG